MARLIFSTRVDGTDVPVFYGGAPGDKPYVGVAELLNILGHSKTHADEFPRSETKLWQDLAPNDSTYPPNKLFTTEVGFAVYFGKTKLTNWAAFKRMFDTIAQYIADPSACNASNPQCMIPPGHSSGCGPCPQPPNGGGGGGKCEYLNAILLGVQNNNALLQAILADIQKLINNGGGGGGNVDLTPILQAIAALTTLVNGIQSSVVDLDTSINARFDTLETRLDTLEQNLNNRLDTFDTRLTALEGQITDLQSDVANILNVLPNLVTTLNAFTQGVVTQWGEAAWDDEAYPVPSIPPITPNVLNDGKKNILSEDVAQSLNSLQKEVKRLNDYTDDFQQILKKVDIKSKERI
uniref:p10 n=1 Tax=Agrotis segetum granulosis virus TaxID=10464 RepID=A0A023MIJ0_GVAS|nr:p10 [Agrotis segetum granulovirus]